MSSKYSTNLNKSQADEQHIFRTINNIDFTPISNYTINDKRLSWEARGLLIYLLSKPKTWVTRTSDIIRQTEFAGKFAAKKKMVRRIFRELIAAGYMTRERFHLPNGQWQWVTSVYGRSISPVILEMPQIPAEITIDPSRVDPSRAHIESNDLTKEREVGEILEAEKQEREERQTKMEEEVQELESPQSLSSGLARFSSIETFMRRYFIEKHGYSIPDTDAWFTVLAFICEKSEAGEHVSQFLEWWDADQFRAERPGMLFSDPERILYWWSQAFAETMHRLPTGV